MPDAHEPRQCFEAMARRWSSVLALQLRSGDSVFDSDRLPWEFEAEAGVWLGSARRDGKRAHALTARSAVGHSLRIEADASEIGGGLAIKIESGSRIAAFASATESLSCHAGAGLRQTVERALFRWRAACADVDARPLSVVDPREYAALAVYRRMRKIGSERLAAMVGDTLDEHAATLGFECVVLSALEPGGQQVGSFRCYPPAWRGVLAAFQDLHEGRRCEAWAHPFPWSDAAPKFLGESVPTSATEKTGERARAPLQAAE